MLIFFIDNLLNIFYLIKFLYCIQTERNKVNEEHSKEIDEIRLGQPGYKQRYYELKFRLKPEDIAEYKQQIK